jgi:hypothetical protein
VTVRTKSSSSTATNTAAKAVDNNMSTRWSSAYSSPQWIRVDLGKSLSLSGVTRYWEVAAAKDFRVEVSSDGSTWTSVASPTAQPKGPRT